MSKIRVLLVDDHAVVRTGLKLVLESEGDIEVIGEARDGFEAIEKARELAPDVVLMDITMPRLNGLEAARQIRKESPQIAVLFLTMHQSEEYFFQALKVGGAGYIPKSAQDTEVLLAVRSVKAGHTYLHPSVAQMLVSDYLERVRGGGAMDPYESLTDREKEVLHLIAAGYTNREIAERLHLSVNTVHNHRTSIMEKLGLHNRMELLKYAIRKGLVSEEG
jgi:two-component system response regulator NreC